MKIVWLESESLRVPLPRPSLQHDWQEYAFTQPQELPDRIKQAEILILNKVKLGEEQLRWAPSLKMVQITATGKDNVDVSACERRGIKVCNVVNYGADSVAEHAFAALLQLVRRIPEWQSQVKSGDWSRSRFFCLHTLPMRTLNQMTLGILGSGAIGSALAAYARAFGMRVVQLERPGSKVVRNGYTGFADGLSECDVVSLHCPLTPETKGLVDKDFLARMKPGGILLNTARGGLVEFNALRTALESGHLFGAALDVLDVEPPPLDHPMLAWTHPRLIVTPHVAWGTEQAQTTLARMAMDQVEGFLKSMT